MSAEDIKNEYDQATEDTIENFLENPIPLQRTFDLPSAYPVESLGDILAPMTHLIACVIQAPIGICAQSILAATALAVQGHADIHIDGRIIPISEFFLTIGVSGERKSAVDAIVLYAHRMYQKYLREQYDTDYAKWVMMNEAYDSAKKEVLRVAKSYEQKKRQMESLGLPPVKPLDPFILMDEPTYEGLIKLLISGHPSIGLFSDEGGRFIGGHGMNNDNLLKTAAGLCGIWDGKQISRIRASDQNALIEGKRVSFHLMAQPNVAQLMLSNTLLIEQGLMSRCLITWPVSTAGNRPYKEVDITNTNEFQKYTTRIADIFKTSLPLAKDKQNELSPRIIKLSAEAKALFISFHDSIEKELGDNFSLGVIRGFANKAPEHALRLAGIITLFYDIHATEVSLQEMSSGIELMSHYINEALRLHNSSMIDPDLILAEKLLAWLQNQKKNEITLQEIYQCGPSSIRTASTAKKMMNILHEHHWVIPIECGLLDQKSRLGKVWRIRS